MKLTAIALKNAKPKDKIYRLFDGGGLYLEITPAGGTYWRYKYRFNGKEKRMAFGVYPDISLQDAREKRRLAKKTLDEGFDPSEQKKLEKIERKANYENNFENIAREWHKQKLHTWNPTHADNIMKRFEVNIFPYIGQRPIKEIKPAELLQAVKILETKGNRDLAHRVMQQCAQIFRYAIATSRAENDITLSLKGALQPAATEHMAYLTEAELPAFLQKLERYEDFGGSILTKLAFKLLVLTFLRSSEIRGKFDKKTKAIFPARWSEIDFEKAQWRVPAERMKMKEQHIVPLARQAIEILRQIQEITGGHYDNYILPSQHNPRQVMSENTFLRVIDVLGYKGNATAHGFRSTASTILNERGYRADVIERQLAHCERNQIRAAYNHAEYLPERTAMMQDWADYIDFARQGGKVIQGKFAIK